MASIKISVDNLNQQKREYEKAVKNLDNALEQIKKVNHSLGNDAMLEEVRNGLSKLSASLETRAGVLLSMTKVLEQSGEKYTATQKKAMTKSNQFRAHNRDFYGNPVAVTAATATTAAAATAATASSASGVDSSIQIESPNTERGTSTTITQVSEHARNTAAPKVDVAGVSEPAEGEITGAVDTGSFAPGANVFVAGAAAAGAVAGAAIGGIAGGAVGALVKSEQKKPKTTQIKQEPSTDIETQLEAARERLRRFNEMEEKEKI